MTIWAIRLKWLVIGASLVGSAWAFASAWATGHAPDVHAVDAGGTGH